MTNSDKGGGYHIDGVTPSSNTHQVTPTGELDGEIVQHVIQMMLMRQICGLVVYNETGTLVSLEILLMPWALPIY